MICVGPRQGTIVNRGSVLGSVFLGIFTKRGNAASVPARMVIDVIAAPLPLSSAVPNCPSRPGLTPAANSELETVPPMLRASNKTAKTVVPHGVFHLENVRCPSRRTPWPSRWVPDELCELVEPPLPPHPRGGPKPVDDRACFAGILFVLKTGSGWEDLPAEMGCGGGMICWRRLRDWHKAGVFQQLHEALLAELRKGGVIDWSHAVVDNASVRAVFRHRRRRRPAGHHGHGGQPPRRDATDAAHRRDPADLGPGRCGTRAFQPARGVRQSALRDNLLVAAAFGVLLEALRTKCRRHERRPRLSAGALHRQWHAQLRHRRAIGCVPSARRVPSRSAVSPLTTTPCPRSPRP
jgi:transposase